MLISKLEKNKAMKPEERAEIMKTLNELTEKISQLKDELKTSSTASTPSKLKSKTEVCVAGNTVLYCPCTDFSNF